MKIGFIGLGKMGSQMVTRLLHDSHEVIVFDLNQAAAQQSAEQGAVIADSREDLITKLGATPIIWLMIPAQFVDQEITDLLKLLPSGSTLVDGGNSDFRLTRERATACQQSGVELVDVGTSGGILGLEHGFSMMVGGNETAFKAIEPVIASLAQPGGYRYLGPTGAGHYVKMIHNAIEYGIMEAYAEGYWLLSEGKDYSDLDLAAIADVWQHGSIIASNLNAVTNEIFKINPSLEGVEGYVTESGEARWTLDVAKAQGFNLPVVQAALDGRLASQQGHTNFGTKLLAAMRNAFGGHHINKDA
jgi:6-phosphogluconate dehydrogenase